MNEFHKDSDHAKNKIAGGVKEAAGKITGNEQLELKGKIQSGKADLKKNVTDRTEGSRRTSQVA